MSDIELLCGTSRLDRRLAFWEDKRLTHMVIYYVLIFAAFKHLNGTVSATL